MRGGVTNICSMTTDHDFAGWIFDLSSAVQFFWPEPGLADFMCLWSAGGDWGWFVYDGLIWEGSDDISLLLCCLSSFSVLA